MPYVISVPKVDRQTSAVSLLLPETLTSLRSNGKEAHALCAPSLKLNWRPVELCHALCLWVVQCSLVTTPRAPGRAITVLERLLRVRSVSVPQSASSRGLGDLPASTITGPASPPLPPPVTHNFGPRIQWLQCCRMSPATWFPRPSRSSLKKKNFLSAVLSVVFTATNLLFLLLH